MLNEIMVVAILLVWSSALMLGSTVQTNLFGGRAVSKNGTFEQEETTKVFLHELLKEMKSGKLTRTIKNWAVNPEGWITLYFTNSTFSVLYFEVLPKYAKKYPNMKADGQRFVEALARATGDVITTDADLNDSLDNFAGSHEITLTLQRKVVPNDKSKKYTSWAVSVKNKN